jgi:Zn-dependent protease
MAGSSPSIGKIYGIDIQIHWLLLLFLLFLLVISVQLFVLVALFYACVLLHEVAHSITSIRNGVKVKRIEVNLLMGESFIDIGRLKPVQEFYVSIAGPIASILMGLAFGFLAIYAPVGFIRLLFQELFILNLLVGGFNLLPGFPLDGGRVFRSYLQERMGKLRATKITVKLGNAIAVLLVIGTVAYVLLNSSNSFLYDELVVFFDAIIAMFMYSGGQAELQAIYLKRYTSQISVMDAISTDFIIEKPSTTLSELYKDILSKHTSIAMFFDGGGVKLVSKLPSMSWNKNDIINSDQPISRFGAEIPNVPYNATLDKGIDVMRFNDSNVAAVTRGKSIVGVLLEQHVESIVALHISHHGSHKGQEKE